MGPRSGVPGPGAWRPARVLLQQETDWERRPAVSQQTLSGNSVTACARELGWPPQFCSPRTFIRRICYWRTLVIGDQWALVRCSLRRGHQGENSTSSGQCGPKVGAVCPLLPGARGGGRRAKAVVHWVTRTVTLGRHRIITLRHKPCFCFLRLYQRPPPWVRGFSFSLFTSDY